MTELTYIQLGSNRGDRKAYLLAAREELQHKCGFIAGQSGIYETEPWGYTDERDYLNQVICLETRLMPLTLLYTLQGIESKLGRQRKGEGYQGRTLDLDILFYGDKIIDLPGLIVPHPRLHLRNFVLKPLCELSPGMHHPVMQKTVRQLWESHPDTSGVEPYHALIL